MTNKVKRPIRPLAQLNRVERHIKKQVQMSNVIDRLYEDQNDKLDYSWKAGYEMASKDAKEVFYANEEASKQIIRNQKEQLTDYENKNADFSLQVENLKQQLLDQAKKHQGRVSTLKNEIDFLSSVNAKDASFFEPQQKFLVENWRHGWKWISTWAFGLITIAATAPIPPEVLAILPDHIRLGIIAGIAISGGILRFVNQSKPLPPADDKGAA
jgi:hypothetical protein